MDTNRTTRMGGGVPSEVETPPPAASPPPPAASPTQTGPTTPLPTAPTTTTSLPAAAPTTGGGVPFSGIPYRVGVAQPDPAQSFLWGAQNLFAALSAMNHKIDSVEFSRCRSEEEQRRRLESVRNFALSIYRQLQTHSDYVRGAQFIAGVEEAATNVVVTKCLPEVWKLRANVEDLSRQIQQIDKVKRTGNANPNHGGHTTNRKGQSAVDGALQEEVEAAVLRLAALGEERIQHIEIVGNGKRYKDGTSMRRIITEDELGKGSYSHLGVPAQWKGHSDAKTINSNFKQITTMFNDVLLPRLDSIEKRAENRLDRLDKRVTILQGLFSTLNSSKNKEPQAGQVQSGNPQTTTEVKDEVSKEDHTLKEKQNVERSPGEDAPRKRYSAKAGRAAFNRAKTNATTEGNSSPT